MGFTIDTSKPLEDNMGVPASQIPFGTEKVGGRRRSRRGGVEVSRERSESDASTVSGASSVSLSSDVDATAEVITKATILSAVVKYFHDNKETLATGATAAAYAALAAGVLFATDKYYSPEVCSLQWQKAVDAMSLAGVTSAKDKCDLAKNAYDSGMAVAMVSAAGLLKVALSKATPTIDVSDGIFAGVKNKIIQTMLGSAAAPAPKVKKVRADASAIGGRTRRRGAKKGRKSRKSRR